MICSSRAVTGAYLRSHNPYISLTGGSLQATYMRNTVIHALRSSTNVNVHDVPHNFIYANPTISALATFISRFVSGETLLDADAEREASLAREACGAAAMVTAPFIDESRRRSILYSHYTL